MFERTLTCAGKLSQTSSNTEFSSFFGCCQVRFRALVLQLILQLKWTRNRLLLNQKSSSQSCPELRRRLLIALTYRVIRRIFFGLNGLRRLRRLRRLRSIRAFSSLRRLNRCRDFVKVFGAFNKPISSSLTQNAQSNQENNHQTHPVESNCCLINWNLTRKAAYQFPIIPMKEASKLTRVPLSILLSSSSPRLSANNHTKNQIDKTILKFMREGSQHC